MVNAEYIEEIKRILDIYLQEGERAFIFGSSVESNNFNDLDLGIISDKPDTEKKILGIKNDLENSMLPYKFDVVNINKTEKSFRSRAINGPKIWII